MLRETTQTASSGEPAASANVRWLDDLDSGDVGIVGGKNASLGEMLQHLKSQGIRVPDGFATTASAYRAFIEVNGLAPKIKDVLDRLRADEIELADAGQQIRTMIIDAEFSEELADDICEAYRELSTRMNQKQVDVAVRSSATAEDLPDASFAGQQETYLNISGEKNLLHACKRCFASLFTDRAISYREQRGFEHMDVALSVGVQKMVRSDLAGAGVMFSIDTETGFPRIAVIDAAWGLGENVVQGAITPDEYRVFKPLLERDGARPIIDKMLGEKEYTMVYSGKGAKNTIRNTKTPKEQRTRFVLNDDQILQLARWAIRIEEHYDRPMDIEWALDGETGELYIVQARPETVVSRKTAGSLKTYELKESSEGLIEGLAIGAGIAGGSVYLCKDIKQAKDFKNGNILVTDKTDPDWVPIMKKAAAIVTDHGGRTSHAAIVSRELGVPAVIGTGEATETLKHGQEVTVSCAEGERGIVYKGILDYTESELDLSDVPETRTRIMMNIASPDAAMRWWQLPAEGIGLARMEFIINNTIKIHPMALIEFDRVEDKKARERIERLTRGYDDKTEYFVEHLARGIARIAASQHPHPVIVRLSDFKTNEYADLIGGKYFEPKEENPMLGFRGASRYYNEKYRAGFALECRALKRVREQIGLDNVVVMVPFCRTIKEADRVIDVMAENGLKRGENGLELFVMAEIPSNVILADEFAERFDGFSIGSNDLTQLVLGIDRDSGELADLFDEQDEAVKRSVKSLIETAHEKGRKVGICGQAPSDKPEFAAYLVSLGIDSMSLNPDSVIQVKRVVAEAERKHG